MIRQENKQTNKLQENKKATNKLEPLKCITAERRTPLRKKEVKINH
jgi:hypothetical protein